jgi:hypothetical protein
VIEIVEFIIKMSLAKVIDNKQEEIDAEAAYKKAILTPSKNVMPKFSKVQRDAKVDMDASRRIDRFNSVYIVEELY